MLSRTHLMLQRFQRGLSAALRQQSQLPRGTKHQHDMTPVHMVSTQKLQTNEDDSDHLTLTREEAISYLENVLQIQDPGTFAAKQKFDFLCEVQRRTKLVQPFSMVSDLPDLSVIRHGQMKEVSKKKMFKREGGGCIQINSFTMAVLRQLGYQAYTVCATLPKDTARTYEAHIGLIVKDATKKGSVHLVEPGTRHPILDPISLDFTRASPEYQLTGYPIKFFRDSPGIVKLCMPISKSTDVERDSNLYHDDGKLWRGMITYKTLEFRNWEYCSKMADPLTMNAHLIPGIHKEIVIFGYSEGLWTMVKGMTFIQYDRNGKKKTLDSSKQTKKLLKIQTDVFLNIPKRMCNAILNIQREQASSWGAKSFKEIGIGLGRNICHF